MPTRLKSGSFHHRLEIRGPSNGRHKVANDHPDFFALLHYLPSAIDDALDTLHERNTVFGQLLGSASMTLFPFSFPCLLFLSFLFVFFLLFLLVPFPSLFPPWYFLSFFFFSFVCLCFRFDLRLWCVCVVIATTRKIMCCSLFMAATGIYSRFFRSE